MNEFVLALLVVIFAALLWPSTVDLAVLHNKRVLITGGGSGIGEEMARLAFSHGAIVTIVGRRQSRLDRVCRDLNQQGPGRCSVIVADMANKSQIVRTVKQTIELMGGIDSLILNHMWGVVKFFEDIPFDDLQETFDLTYNANVLGNMWLIHQLLPHLKKTIDSHILFVSSLSITYGIPKTSFYASSKLAMHGVLDALRMELGPKSNISITIANVGAVATQVFKDAMMNPKDEEKAAMDPTKCGRLLLEYMVSKRREVLMPLVDKPVPIPGLFSWLFPELMEALVRTQYSITDEKQGFIKDAGGQPPTE